MRTKFFSYIALAATLLGLGSLASCKDTSEDDYNELKVELSDQSSAIDVLKQQVSDLQVLQKNLKAKVDSINSCTCDPTKWVSKAELDNLIASYLQSHPQGATSAQINQLIEDYLKAKGYSPAAGYATQSWANSQIKVATDSLIKMIQAIDTCQCNYAYFFDCADITLSQVVDSIGKVKQFTIQVQQTAQTALSTANEALRLAQSDSVRIDTLSNTVAGLCSTVNGMKTKLDDAYAKAYAAYVLAGLDSVAIHETNLRIDSLNKVLNDTMAVINQSIVDSIANVRSDIASALETAKQYAAAEDAKVKEELKHYVDSVSTADKQALTAAYQKADSALQDSIDSLARLIAGLDSRLKSVENELVVVKGDITALQNSLANLVTGVIVENVYNPVYGSLLTPFGIQSNVLVAYHGKFAGNSKGSKLKFPTSEPTYYSDASDALTAQDLKMLGVKSKTLADAAGQNLITNEAGNAGTLYLTVNPISVDFSGKVTPSLVNTQGVVSGVKLSPLAASDETLKFGYTRGASAGYYAVQASVNEEDIDNVQRVDINKTEIKTALKDILNTVKSVEVSREGVSYSNGLNLTQIATTVYGSVNDMLDATGVQVSYTDSLGYERKVVSKHDIAATVINPLSYKFGSTFDFQTVPGYEKATSLIKRANKTINRVVDDVDFHISVDLSGLTNIDLIHIDNIKLSPIHITLDTLSYNLGDQFKKTVSTTLQTIAENDTTINGKHYAAGDTIPWKYTYTPNLEGLIPDTTKITIPMAVDSVKEDGTHYIGYRDTTITVKLNIHVDPSNVGSVTIDGEKVILSFTADYTDAVKELIMQVNGMMDGVEGIEDQMNAFIDQINDYLESVNSAMASVNGIIGQVKSLGDQIEDALNGINGQIEDALSLITDKVDRVTDIMLNVLESVNNRICNFVNGINDKLQPVLIGRSANGSGFALSGLKSAPTPVAPEFTVFLTSYTAELVAPAYKKFVGVTNVFNGTASAQGGDAACLAALQAANSCQKVNTILEGAVHGVDFEGLQKGYTYEIVYSAVDFSGIIVADKYYVTVK